MRLQGQANDFKIQYSSAVRIFWLPKVLHFALSWSFNERQHVNMLWKSLLKDFNLRFYSWDNGYKSLRFSLGGVSFVTYKFKRRVLLFVCIMVNACLILCSSAVKPTAYLCCCYSWPTNSEGPNFISSYCDAGIIFVWFYSTICGMLSSHNTIKFEDACNFILESWQYFFFSLRQILWWTPTCQWVKTFIMPNIRTSLG